MNRYALRKYFKTQGPAILPVIHVLNNEQTHKNVQIAIKEGVAGVFLINHDFGVDEFLPIIRHIRSCFPSLWLGVNFLGVTGLHAFATLAELCETGCEVDGYWADDARIDENRAMDDQEEAKAIMDAKADCGWNGLYFGGTAFKKQRPVDEKDYLAAAELGAGWMDVVTTSGVATGEEAGTAKVATFRQGVGDQALALASGITPWNIHRYVDDLDAVLVATGINHDGDFYHISPTKLRRLIEKARLSNEAQAALNRKNHGQSSDRNHRWYLDLMAPRTRGEKYAWLDPSAAYVNGQSFHDMLDDLCAPFNSDEIDVVAGFDAAGFVLGAGMATRLGKGFLTIRKGGKIPVDFDVVPMLNYSGKPQEMEMRKPAFAKGTRVLLVDQWIETGGTMASGIELVERQGGVVGGIAAVCVEENPASESMREKYKVVSCVVSDSDIRHNATVKRSQAFGTSSPRTFFRKLAEKL